MKRPVRITSTMSSAMLSEPMAMVHPPVASAWIGGAAARRAAMAALCETKARLCASSATSEGAMKRQWAAIKSGPEEVVLEEIFRGPHAA